MAKTGMAESKTAVEVSPLVYRPAPGWQERRVLANTETIGDDGLTGSAPFPAAPSGSGAANDERLQEARQQGWEAGLKEGLLRGNAAAEAENLGLREAMGDALRDFARARDGYFHNVEGEVVALALAVVRKILRREAQVDPLLLSGLVRVALEKMAAGHSVRMRVHPSQVACWRDYFAERSELPFVPELSGDATLEQNRCQIETELGVTDISLETQLKEIEQGLFDLLAQRPAPK
jgi:flagellar assembly protein FliH